MSQAGAGATTASAALVSPVRLAAYYAASFAALGVFLPFWPRWLAARGVEGLALGLVAAVVPAVAIVAPLAAGWVADTFRLRGVLLRLACAAAFFAFGLITLAGAGPLAAGAGPGGVAFLLAATALFALARSPMVLLADVLAFEAPGGARGYGTLRRYGSLGFLVAAVATSALVPLEHPYAVPALVTVALGGALVASFGLPRHAAPLPRADREGVLAFVRRPGILALLGASTLLHAAHAAYDVTFSLQLRDLGLADGWVGPAWALGVAAEIFLFSRPGRLLDLMGHEGLVRLAAVGAIVRWAALATLRDPVLVIALQPLHALSFGCLWLGATGVVAQRAPPHHLASAQGAFSACSAVGHAAGMLLWPVVRARTDGGLVFAGAAALAMVAVVPAWSLGKRRA